MAMSAGVMVAASLLTSAAGTGFNIFSQNEAYKVRERQIRAAQTTLRLEKTQADIANMENLEHILARQEVMAGVRNIRADSGSLAALANDTFSQYDRLNDINKMNYKTKEMGLREASLANTLEKRNGQIQAGLGFVESAVGVGMKYKSLLDMEKMTRQSVPGRVL